MLAFGTVADDHWLVARLRSDQTMDQPRPRPERRLAQPGREPACTSWCSSTCSRTAEPPECRYVHLIDEVLTDMAAKECDLVALVPPAGMEHVAAIASNLEKMPPKSTYFYPKLLTGMVLNPLK